MPRTLIPFLILTLTAPILAADHAPAPEFDRIVIDDNFPGAYQVEIADINGDKKPDIIALGGSTVAWYENPTWKKRIITDKSSTPSVISSATRDLDGDGLAEVAIAYDFEMNQPHRGELLLAIPGRNPRRPLDHPPHRPLPQHPPPPLGRLRQRRPPRPHHRPHLRRKRQTPHLRPGPRHPPLPPHHRAHQEPQRLEVRPHAPDETPRHARHRRSRTHRPRTPGRPYRLENPGPLRQQPRCRLPSSTTPKWPSATRPP